MARQKYLNAPTKTALQKGKIQRPDYTLTAHGKMGGTDLYLSAEMVEEVRCGLGWARNEGVISPEGEWLLRDLESLEEFGEHPWTREPKDPKKERWRENIRGKNRWIARLQSRYTEGALFGLPKITVKEPTR